MARANRLGDDLKHKIRNLSFHQLEYAIVSIPLDKTSRIRLGERIAAALVDGSITAREAKRLVRLNTGRKRS